MIAEPGRLDDDQQAHEKQMPNKIDIIVTRNPNLPAFLIEQGLATPDTPVLERATTQDVRGKHVVGTLPHHLSSKAHTFTEIPLRLSQDDRTAMRGPGLSVDRLRRIAGEPATYKVVEGHWGTHPGLAWHAAYEYTFGFGGPSGIWKKETWCGLDTYVLLDVTQQLAAEVMPDRGVWRPYRTKTWIDGVGQHVADVHPAPDWGFRIRPAGCIEADHPNRETGFRKTYHWSVEWRRWETPADALAACPDIGLLEPVEIVAGSDHGFAALVHETWAPAVASAELPDHPKNPLTHVITRVTL
jgi:hypothetical protein